jgi:hypothetical protein
MVTDGTIQDEQQCGLVEGTFLSLSESHHKNMWLIGLTNFKMVTAGIIYDERQCCLVKGTLNLGYWAETNFKMVTAGAIQDEQQCRLVQGTFLSSASHHNNMGLISLSILRLLSGNQLQDGDRWRHL